MPEVYVKHPRQLSLPGLDPFIFQASKTDFCCTVYCAFASFISPFMGFLGSGLKRAFHIKDFSTMFPGHGGFADRMDCISLTCIFTYVMVTQVIFRDEVLEDEIILMARSLPTEYR